MNDGQAGQGGEEQVNGRSGPNSGETGGDQASGLGNLNLSREGTGQGLHLSWGSPSGEGQGCPQGAVTTWPVTLLAMQPTGPAPFLEMGAPGSHRAVCRLSYFLHLLSGLRV